MTQALANLQDQLNAHNQRSREKLPPPALNVLENSVTQLQEQNLAANALSEGDTAPDFTLPNVDGSDVALSVLVQEGPVVLTFYRGGWCPYCNIQLRSYQAALPTFQAEGASLVAVSPQTPDNSLSTAEKAALSFYVLSDQGNVVARDYGLTFTVPQELFSLYRTIGMHLDTANGTDGYAELPMPATYVIDRNRVIRHAFVTEDYKQREEPSVILEQLQALNADDGGR